jgi:LysM domain
MLRPLALVIAALLFGCIADVGPASAQPTAAAEAPYAAPASGRPRPRIYLFRGFASVIMYRGLDQLAEKIERAGFATTINEAVLCDSLAMEAIRDYHREAAPIVVIGHSIGALCALNFAAALQSGRVPVSLIVTTDAPRIARNVPGNVERYINIFQSNSVVGGCDVRPAPGFHGHYASYDLVEHSEITHVNMEKTQTVQDQLVTKIKQLSALPKSEGEAVPLHYVVPADAAIELWDSGMPVFAHADDTLATLAAQYHVPLWSIAQINRLPEDAPLTGGQRVVVPRHLDPLAAPDNGAVSAQAPPKR